jgi:pimeloyl-ACP methyl ester carboxylesterase
MRTIICLFLLLAVVSLAQAADAPSPCTTATANCIDKVPLGGKGNFTVVYRNFPLTQKNERIERALIVVHGAGRNANSYFVSGVAAALVANKLDTTLVLAPRFASNAGGECNDKLEKGEISWSCGGENDWRGGGAASSLKEVFAFDLVDDLIRTLSRRDLFPKLKTVVVSGHSAGGQFTARYAPLAKELETNGVAIKYAVLNPSAYLYLDATRLPPSATCSEKGGCTADFRAYREGQNCTTFNRWRYGLEKRAGYNMSLSDDDIRKQMAARNVTYLVGEFDTLPVYGFDSSCPAMAQGPTRQARGINYWNYMKLKYKAEHRLVIVPACGHNGRCMYTADMALPVLFP